MTKLGITMDVSGVIPGTQAIEHRMDLTIDPNLPNDQIRHLLVKVPYRDESFTIDLTLESILTDCIKHKVFPIININAVWWYKFETRNKITPAQYANICRIAAEYMAERGFKKGTALISCFNEPGKWLTTEETCTYTNAVQDAVGDLFEVVYGNDEFNMLDWNYLGRNCKAKCMAIHHLSSVGFWDDPYKFFSNIKDCATIAATYQKRILGSECGSWFNDYCSDIGHKVNLDIMRECKKYNYDFCLTVLVHNNQANWGLLGYLLYDDTYTKVLPGSSQAKFDEFIEFIKTEGETEVIEVYGIEINLVKPGCHNEETRAVQQIMLDEGYDLGEWGADSWYGECTEAAIRKWQTDNSLRVDGIVGSQTWNWIIANIPTGATRFVQMLARTGVYK